MKRECNECFTLFEPTTQEMFCSESCKTDFDARLRIGNEIVDKMLEDNPHSIHAPRLQNNSLSAQNLISMIRTTQEQKED